MIRILALELLHWDMQPHQLLPLDSAVNLITGENGSGKTSILDALKIVLGLPRLSGDRNVGDYLTKQGRARAMVRAVVANEPRDEDHRRPFDVLGEFHGDRVSLAVVFEGDEEGSWNRVHYMLDGDVAPPLEPARGGRRAGEGPRRLTVTDFRERLARVGVTESYLKLLGLPQGQVARLCAENGERLFDYLYDLIGGRETLDDWQDRCRELAEVRQQHEASGRDLEAARRDLRDLEARVARHRSYVDLAERVSVGERAQPHMRLRELVVRRGLCESRLSELGAETESLVLLRVAKQGAADEAERLLAGGAQEEERHGADVARVEAEWREATTEGARRRARLEELEKLRLAAEGVPDEPLDLIEGRSEELRVEVATGEAEARSRAERRHVMGLELEQLERGLLPYPPEVEAFRAVLRGEGIPHHLLAEVVEVADRSWNDAIEAYLDRYRLAVLVQDPADWPRAAALARAARYAPGVLAPDVRGHSSADDESIFDHLEVREPRYRSLLARLLRPVRGGEPEEPFEPAARFEVLARDGFVLSRIEARVARTDRVYLGRTALEHRRAQLQGELHNLAARDEAWRSTRASLADELAALEARGAAQRRRLAWEACRDEHARCREEAAGFDSSALRLDETRRSLALALRLIHDRRNAAARQAGEAQEAVREAVAELGRLDLRQTELRKELSTLDEERGALIATEPPEADGAVTAMVEKYGSVESLQSALRAEREMLGRVPDADRDPLLPVNFERQGREVAAVARRLTELGESLESTKAATDRAHDQYRNVTRLVFRDYFARLREAASALDFTLDGRLEDHENGRFRCDVRVAVADKPPVHHDSEALSGGQKAALSILMGMTAVSDPRTAAGFFIIDEPFAASDVYKINELGRFLERTGAQYLVSMPTSADIQRCGTWLRGVWTCTRSRGGSDAAGGMLLAPPVKLSRSTEERRPDA